MMIFFEEVQFLQKYHPDLWFCTGTPNPAADVVKSPRWKSAAFFSPGGHRLASMAGSENEWKLAADYWKPGPPPSQTGPHDCVLLTNERCKQVLYEIMS